MVAFINSRPVDSRTMNGALMESYRESLPQGRYPVAFLFLECDPAQVDVNVHPAKREVRFRSEAIVRGFIIRSVLSLLREHSGAVGAPAVNAEPLGAPANLPSAFQPWAAEEAHSQHEAGALAPALQVGISAAAAPHSRSSGEASPWRFMGMAHGAFVLFETLQGLVLLDRRAAHERIWYERLREQFARSGVPVQRLLLPIPIELNPVSSALLVDHLGFLARHGLEASEFGRNFFRIEAIPSWMEPGDAEGFIRDFLGAAREGRLPASDLELARDELARMASARAVRLPALAGAAECAVLLAELFSTSNPGSSPTGHPTYVELNHAELARRFQK